MPADAAASSPSVTDLQRRIDELSAENARLRTEMREASEQQAATSQVLEVINSSHVDQTPVFDTILKKAHALCGVAHGSLQLFDGEKFRAVALHNAPDDVADRLRQGYKPGPYMPVRQLLGGAQFVHVRDLAEIDHPIARAAAKIGMGTTLYVALRKDDRLLGQIVAARDEVRDFSEKEITLLQSFAQQAVIAIENARLLGELRQRTDDLTESLEYQTATSELLEVISRSASNIQPVMDTILAAAARLCGTASGAVAIRRDSVVRVMAVMGVSAEVEAALRERNHTDQSTLTGRTLLAGRVIHVDDLAADADYSMPEIVRIAHMRTALGVPLLRDGESVGAIVLSHDHVEPFSERQIGLIRTFADQAVIAMENARLLGELRQRTDDLTESLEYQTATSDVLKVISRSTFDLQPVLDTLSATAARLCAAELSFMTRREGDAFRFVTAVGATPETTRDAILLKQEVLDKHLFRPGRDTITGRVVAEGGVVQIVDVVADAEYALTALTTVGKIKTLLGVPLMREGEVIGTMSLARQRIEPFTDRQIELIRTFADQAVIAMENARLLSELRESLDQQTATAEVLEVINASPGDLQPVFDAMLERAMRLCGAFCGGLFTYDGQDFQTVTTRGVPPALAEYRNQNPPTSANERIARMLQTKHFVQVIDLTQTDDYRNGDPADRATADLGGARTILNMPLLKDDTILGMFSVYRKETRAFTGKQIDLLGNFAEQAVIAMENARLLVEQREALEQQTATAEVLQVINSSPGDLAPVFDAMLEKAMRLCEAQFGGLTSYDGERFHTLALLGLAPDVAETFREPWVAGSGSYHEDLVRGERLVHADFAANSVARRAQPQSRALAEIGGARTGLLIALRKDDALLGSLWFYRTEVRPFSTKQIALLQNFADQAVIAMENARLIAEQREALEQQTATAEVLQVINSSPGRLEPVFEAMLQKALRLCEADAGFFGTRDGEAFSLAALQGLPPDVAQAFADSWRQEQGPRHVHAESGAGRIERGEPIVHILDSAGDAVYRSGNPGRRILVDVGGARTQLCAALRKDGVLLGVIIIWRREVRAFTDKQMALLQNFAAQAVIAMENVRLLEELRDRQAELRVTFDNMGDGVAMFDAEPRLVAWNRNFEEIIGLPDALLAERPSYADYLRLLADRGEFGTENVEAELASRLENTGRELRLERTRADGTVIEVRRNAVPGGGFVLIYSDVTEQRRAEAAIRAARDAAEAALERQTATADILKVIASSPTDVQPVLEAVAKAAVRFCGAADALINLRDGESWIPTAHEGPVSANLGVRFPLHRETANGRSIVDGLTCHLPDIAALDLVEFASAQRFAKEYGFRAVVSAPLLRDGVAIGSVGLRKAEPEPFTPAQISLLETFAAQAVIAIENVRLFTELRESLEQQTATAEILRAISQSPTDVQPVLDAVVKAAVRFCGASDASITLREETEIAIAAHAGNVQSEPAGTRTALDRGTVRGRSILDAETVHLPDVLALEHSDFGPAQQLARMLGFRGIVSAPMMRDDGAIGCITLRKAEPEAFTPRQVELLETFAAQAVIAIENVRLFTELRDALEQQTATAEILRVISQSPTDVTPVLDAVAKAAVRFCGAEDASIFLKDGVEVVFAAHEGPIGSQERGRRDPLDGATIRGQAIIDGRTIHMPDAAGSEGAAYWQTQELARQKGFHAVLAAPMLREEEAIGSIALRKSQPIAFTPRQIELLETFAAQAVIAIENVRLFIELRDLLERLKAAQANLIQSEKMASLGQLTAGIAHEIKNPLNFVNNFAGLSSELLDELKQAVDALLAEPDEDKRAELQETMDLLTGNLAKIVEHGRRADGIVKSMLAHSRGGTGDWQASNINALVDEALSLAYHGARAQDRDFNVILERDFAAETKPIEVVPQDVTRVFLNLFGNGFYAANKRQFGGAGSDYRPTLTVSTRDLAEAVEIRVRDNGTGISPEVRAKLFQPFFTTKPTGEGTGLGLSISYDIVTQQHGGTIEVESEPGSFTEFTVRLPRRRRVV